MEIPKGLPVPKKAIIVDTDAVFVPLAQRQLELLGIQDIVVVDDGEAAFQRLQGAEFELIIMSWKPGSMPGIKLFNRIRHSPKYSMTPLLAVSGKLSRDDFRLLDEFPVTQLLEKPATAQGFLKGIRNLLVEAEWYRKRRPLLKTLFTHAYQNAPKVKDALKKLLKDAPNPVPTSLLVADTLFQCKHITQSETVYRKVYEMDQESVAAMNGIGKCLYKQGRHEEAFVFLRMAWRLAEKNIERLCLLGEIEVSQHDTRSAREYFRMALDIDDGYEKAVAGITICDNLDQHVQLHSGVGLPRNFASLCNSVAISLVRAEKMQRGIDQYHAALNFLNEPELSALVMFNVGLGYLRWQKPEDALIWFRKSSEIASPFFHKSKQYVERLEQRGVDANVRGTGVAQVVGGDYEFVVEEITAEDIQVEGVEIDDNWFEDIYE